MNEVDKCTHCHQKLSLTNLRWQKENETIIAELVKDSRISLTKLSKITKMPISTLQIRILRLRDDYNFTIVSKDLEDK